MYNHLIFSIVFDDVTYKIHEHPGGTYLMGAAQWEWFANSDGSDVACFAAQRYRAGKRIIKETAV